MKGPWRQMETGNRAPKPRADRPDISASEIQDFLYCARSWWLRRDQQVAIKTPEMTAGTQAHRLAGDFVAETVVLERVVRACAGLTVLIAGAIGYLWLVR
ncbi:MAG TPA: PD-(D/E)XK nuclease family protein [Spirochaetia bacterium]|nr:PD-(D/E)XK nuclease family protein [Spirochaetia bacterium]